MRTRSIIAAVAAITALALLPAQAHEPTDFTERYKPTPPGTEKTLTYFFGPYLVPPGQDANRITVDLPLTTGFILAVAPNMIDATTDEEIDERVGHIHHAHWFRVSNNPNEEYNTANLVWVFGTGEERTQGSLDDRADVVRDPVTGEPSGPRYGIPVDGTAPQVLVYMLHNKTSGPLTVYVTLDVKFVFGSLEEVNAANPARPMRPLTGTLWGETRDATTGYPTLGADYIARGSGTAIASAGHLHPGGLEDIIVNLGPALYNPNGSYAGKGACVADLDGDGYPGTTILHSRKHDRAAEAFPYSEEYQMGATKFGWRAPIHKGDVLRQIAPYDVGKKKVFDPVTGVASIVDAPTVDGKTHAWYQAMSYAGIYVDRAEAPTTGTECEASNFAPWLIGDDTPEVQAAPRSVGAPLEPDRYLYGATEGVINHQWHHAQEPLCGLSTPGWDGPCENNGNWSAARTDFVDTIHVGAFLYAPGDMALDGSAQGTPKVKRGTSLRFINEDAVINVRHTFTSCTAPCRGEYVMNYPLPNGAFDSGKLGNLDPIDGGLRGPDTVPVYNLDTSKLPVGLTTYYCRIHPFMRGAFEVVA